MSGVFEAVAISTAVSLASAGLTYALTPDQKIEGQRLKDLTTAKSNYGSAIPWCWGTVRIGGNKIWSSYKEEKKKKEKQGKGAKVESTTYSYYGYYASLFCECPFRPIVDVKRLWQNKNLVYSIVGDESTIAAGAKYREKYLRFYKGDPVQQIDPLLQNKESISN